MKVITHSLRWHAHKLVTQADGSTMTRANSTTLESPASNQRSPLISATRQGLKRHAHRMKKDLVAHRVDPPYEQVNCWADLAGTGRIAARRPPGQLCLRDGGE